MDQSVSIKIITAFFVSSDFLHHIRAELSNLQLEKLSILQMLKAGKGNCSRCVLHGIEANAHQIDCPREVQSCTKRLATHRIGGNIEGMTGQSRLSGAS